MNHEPEAVALPRNVIDVLERSWRKVNIAQPKAVKHLAMTNWEMLRRLSDEDMLVLFNFASSNPIAYISALVYGYTIEQTTEDRIHTYLMQCLIDMQVSCPVPIERLAKVLVLSVREALAEDQSIVSNA